MSLEQFNKYSPMIATVICFSVDLIFITLGFSLLALIAAIIGGLFCVEMKWGALAGALGIFLAWLTAYLFAINDIVQQADQLGQLIFGAAGAGMLIVVLIFLVGALFGFLGGSIGSGIRMLILPSLDKT
jgi:hypothetical protein